MKRVLVIEDDQGIRENILDLMEAEGFCGVGAANGKDGVIAALKSPPDVIICDVRMPELDGYGVLKSLRDRPETAAVPFIFLTAGAEKSDIRTGMSMGADDYLTKPFTRTELLDAVQARLRRHDFLSSRQNALPDSPAPKAASTASNGTPSPRRVVVHSAEMQALHEEAGRAAASNLSILLLGETGVGKEVFAHEIHRRSSRTDGPFVPVNCAALTESLLESELFGHEKGAFTGAMQDQPGVFEAADGGTLFLDEIGEMGATTQAKLLRVLEDRAVTRVGSRKVRHIDVRFVTATNRDLESEVEKGNFRKDLYFRINSVVLQIPALRDRSSEVEPLARVFLSAAAKELQLAEEPVFTAETLRALRDYSWPGNVRELRNAVDRCVAMCRGSAILPEHLPAQITGSAGAPAMTSMDRLQTEMNDLERKRIINALDECGGNQTKAAALLGISRRTLVSRLDAYGLPRPRKRSS
jgi:DNA-binding NtrC family response regulator